MGRSLEISTVETFAAEHALGVLSVPARTVAQARMVFDLSFARRVARWRARLAALLEPIEPVAVSPALWKRIERALGEPESIGIRRSAAVMGALLLAGSGLLLARILARGPHGR